MEVNLPWQWLTTNDQINIETLFQTASPWLHSNSNIIIHWRSLQCSIKVSSGAYEDLDGWEGDSFGYLFPPNTSSYRNNYMITSTILSWKHNSQVYFIEFLSFCLCLIFYIWNRSQPDCNCLTWIESSWYLRYLSSCIR